MIRRLCVVAILATGLMAATCEKKVDVVQLAKIPADVPPQYVTCFRDGASIPEGKTTFTQSELKGYFARFVASDAAHKQCGKDLIAWYRNLAKAYNRKG